jgi:pimeloyl-ACP methyl ester carboxylesterase
MHPTENEKPGLVFVHGGWHTPECFDPIISELKTHGYESAAPKLPTIGASPPLNNFDPDVAAVRAAILSFLEVGRDVIVIPHSYGGLPASEAIKGLAKPDREKAGFNTGVLQIIYISSFIFPENTSIASAYGLPLTTADGYWTGPPNPADAFYNDLPAEQAAELVKKLEPWSYGAVVSPITYAAWRDIPSTFIYTEDDHVMKLVQQDSFVDTVTKGGADIVVVNMKTSHSPFLSQIERTGEIIRMAAEGKRDELVKS